MCIIFNSIGVPYFMQGEIRKRILRIVLGIITFGIIEIINFVKGIILGVQVLKMTDEEFAEKNILYQAVFLHNKKGLLQFL